MRRKGLWSRVFGVAVAVVLLLGLVVSCGGGRDYRGFIVTLINGGKPDHDAVVAAFTGAEVPGVSGVKSSVLPKKYDPDEMFKTLFSVNWSADSKVESLFTWMPGTGGVDEGVNRAFSEVFLFLSDEGKYGVSVRGTDVLGRSNVKLAEGVRAAAAPYHNLFAGGSPRQNRNYGFVEVSIESIFSRTIRFYSILASSPVVGTALARDALAQVERNAAKATKGEADYYPFVHPFEWGMRSGYIEILLGEGFRKIDSNPAVSCAIRECVDGSVWNLAWHYAMLAAQSVKILPQEWMGKTGKLKPLSELVDYVNGDHELINPTRAINTISQIDTVLRENAFETALDDFEAGTRLASQNFHGGK